MARLSISVFVPLSMALAACAATPEAPQGADGVRAALSRRDFGEAATLARALALKQPKNADTQFLLARAEALAGNDGNALAALDAALANGLARPLDALGDPAFDTLREREAFIAISLQAAPPSPHRIPLPSVQQSNGGVAITEQGDHTVVHAGDVVISY